MNSRENHVTYTSKNSYSTLNNLSAETENVWIVFHGIGYLSRYFLKYFDKLPADKNYIIAPQAPSKYYLNSQYRHVGASWLTKEATSLALGNLMNYIDSVYEQEDIPEHCNLIILGYSQGVSIAMRWVASRKIRCRQLILYAGGIPEELKYEDFSFMEADTKVKVIVGDADEYLTPERMKIEQRKIELLFPAAADVISFAGKHEIKKEIIIDLV